MKTKGGRKLLKRRRQRGRKNLTVSSTVKKNKSRLMKSKIVALSKNEEFKNLLKKERLQINMSQFFWNS